MPVKAHPTRPKARWSTQSPRPSPGTHAQLYRRRRPETTTLHRIVREHLETYLALANGSDPMGDGVPDHVEKEFRSYLKCGILAHGFARARCATCGYDFLVAFSCKGRGACPSCNAKRMTETAAHLVDHVFPHVSTLQAGAPVGSVRSQAPAPLPSSPTPNRQRRPSYLASGSDGCPQRSLPHGPKTAAMGAVSFLRRFGSSLNPHFHLHLIVVDGLFERVEADMDPGFTHPEPHFRFHEATSPTHELLERLQDTIRRRVLRHFCRHGLLEPYDTEDMLGWDHGGGFNLDASVRIEATDREGLERGCSEQRKGYPTAHTAGSTSSMPRVFSSVGTRRSSGTQTPSTRSGTTTLRNVDATR